ncbi:DNA translocase FtsK, partial [bacterium]|nr:DNA translocase FtsK [bacterium]
DKACEFPAISLAGAEISIINSDENNEGSVEPLCLPRIEPSPEQVQQSSFHTMMEKQLWEGNLPEQIDYKFPSTSIFKSSSSEGVTSISEHEMRDVGELLTKTLLDFGVTGKIIGYQPGPVVTVYEFQPDAGIKQSKIIGLIDDIALSLKVDSILIQPVKGKRALGVQVPNSNRQVVFFGDVVTSPKFNEAPSPLTFAMGKALDGQPVLTDLTGMPHLLVAGATGSGKSVGINSLICSVVMKASPAEVRMILVDPKMLELSVYEGIPHLLMPVITEAAKASLALRWAVNEMERRYKIMQTVQVRNIQAFNAFWKKQTEESKAGIRDKLGDQEIDHLPFILLVIDELADLMLTAPKEVESVIQRLAQKARASGIHMVLATQRPSVDIITGVIKANLPSRIAFQVVSKHDSRTILDQMGADKLLGKGDMLFQKPGISKIDRIQGAFVSDEEVVDLVNQIKLDHPASYNEDLIDWIDNEASKQDVAAQGGGIEFDDDPKWDDAITIAQRNGQISASFLQRQLKIGYNRAARIVEAMESQGLVDKSSGSKPRKWIGPQETALAQSSLIED